MADYLTNTEDLTIVANAIRAKGGTSAPLEFPQGMADAVSAISGGGGCDPKVQAIYDAFLLKMSGQRYDIYDDVTLHLAKGAFGRDPYIRIATFSAVTTVDSDVFSWGGVESITLPRVTGIPVNFAPFSKTLRFADIGVSTILDASSLKNTALDTLIIRTSSVCNMTATNAIGGTPIGTGTGYIYVPKNLVEQYKAATNWVTYATQIRAIEDYPDITGGV